MKTQHNACFFRFLFKLGVRSSLFLSPLLIILCLVLSILSSVPSYLLSTPPLPPFPLGQQCGSSVVSIIIIQSALHSTRNCQPSTNTGLAINAISTPLSLPLLLCLPFLVALLVSLLFVFLSNLLFQSTQLTSRPLVSFPSSPLLQISPLSSISGSSSVFSSFSLVFILVHPRSEL